MLPGMSDDPIRQRALERRDTALREAEEWEAFIRRYDDLQDESPGAPPVVRVDQHGVPRAVVGMSGRVSETERVAAEIIRERGRPVGTRDLLAELERRGVEVGGKDPFSTLSARLTRAPTLVGTRGIGWSLKTEARQTNETAGPSQGEEPAASAQASGALPPEAHTSSSPVKPAAGGGI